MSIIKNLILRNTLRDKLNEIERTLETNGYYEKEKQLIRYIRKPDQYAELYLQIQDEYGDIIAERNHLCSKINNLSGINLFKKNDEYTQ